MSLCVSEWLRATMRDPLWRLTADQFRIAMALIAIADVRDGTPRITASTSELERYFGLPRSKVRRALESLERAGFLQMWASKGRGGATLIILRDTRPFKITKTLPHPERKTDSQDVEMVCESLADLGDRGHLAGTIPGTIESCDSEDLGESSGNRSGGRARDLDLLRSPGDLDLRSDLRSPDSQDLRKNTEESPSAKMATAPWVDPDAPQEDQTAKPRIDPDSIPDRAWAAADYLRFQVLQENRGAYVGTKPWEPGWEFPAGAKPTRIGDGSRTGLRLSWAHGFRLVHGVALTALRNAAPAAGDAEAWTEIARTVRWLFLEQPVEARFVVESPDSLREKWYRIQTVRKNHARAAEKAKQPRGADNRPDPAAQRQFRTLTKENL